MRCLHVGRHGAYKYYRRQRVRKSILRLEISFTAMVRFVHITYIASVLCMQVAASARVMKDTKEFSRIFRSRCRRLNSHYTIANISLNRSLPTLISFWNGNGAVTLRHRSVILLHCLNKALVQPYSTTSYVSLILSQDVVVISFNTSHQTSELKDRTPKMIAGYSSTQSEQAHKRSTCPVPVN